MNSKKLCIQLSQKNVKYILQEGTPESIFCTDFSVLQSTILKLRQVSHFENITDVSVLLFSQQIALHPMVIGAQEAFALHDWMHLEKQNVKTSITNVQEDMMLSYSDDLALLEMVKSAFPNGSYFNANAHFLNFIYKNENVEKPAVYVNIYNTEMEIAAWNGKQILLYNIFQFTCKEDFIYYILYVYEKSGMNVLQDDLYLTGDILVNAAIHEFACRYIKNVHIGIHPGADALFELLTDFCKSEKLQ